MTEEETLEQQTEATPSAQPRGAAPAEKKPAPLIVIAVGLVLLLGITVVVLYFFVFSEGSDQSISIPGVEDSEFIDEFAGDYIKRKQTEDSLFIGDEEPIFTKEFTYTVNLADGRHMLKLSWKAMMYDQLAMDYLMNKKLTIDDTIATMLSKLTSDEINTRSGLDLIKRDIFKELNAAFDQSFIEQSESRDRSPVKRIAITEFFVK